MNDARKAFPLRINAEILAAVQRWADDDLRSLNAQIEYLLREALRQGSRLPKPARKPPTEAASTPGKQA